MAPYKVWWLQFDLQMEPCSSRTSSRSLIAGQSISSVIEKQRSSLTGSTRQVLQLFTLPKVPELDEHPTLDQVKTTVLPLKNKNAPSGNVIPDEVYKYDGFNLLVKLTDFALCWKTGKIPDT